MKIDLHKIKIAEVVKAYKDSAEEGVSAFGGKLDIRPKYQREFVYKEKQRNAVIETIKNSFPLNVEKLETLCRLCEIDINQPSITQTQTTSAL